jgi:hypothetical protein
VSFSGCLPRSMSADKQYHRDHGGCEREEPGDGLAWPIYEHPIVKHM